MISQLTPANSMYYYGASFHFKKGLTCLSAVKRFLSVYSRLEAYRFPGYAPELNPDEFIWAKLKRTLANSIPNGTNHLRQLLVAPVRRLKNSQKLLWSCIKASELPW